MSSFFVTQINPTQRNTAQYSKPRNKQWFTQSWLTDRHLTNMMVCFSCVEDTGCEAAVAKILAAGADHHVLLQWNLPVHRRCQVDP